MRVLVTGGSGFIGSHVVDKLIDTGHEVRLYDLAPSPYRSPEEVDFRCGDITSLEAITEASRGVRRDHPPRRRRRRQRRRRGSREGADHQLRGHAQRARGRPAGRGAACRLRLDDLGLLRLPRARGRRGHARRASKPPLHGHEARGRALLQVLLRALRRRVHDPALRHPVRPTRSRRHGARRVLRQGRARRAPDGRGRRQPVAALRLRRGPGRGRRRRPAARGRQPALQPHRRRGHHDPADRRGRARPRRGLRHRPHPGPQGRPGLEGGLLRAGAPRAGLDRGHPLRRGLSLVPRLAPRAPRAPQGADPHRRHRRGPRSSRPRPAARPAGRASGQRGRGDRRPARHGAVRQLHRARRLVVLVQLGARDVPGPVPAAQPLRADPLAFDSPGLPARLARADARDPRLRPGRDRVHLSRHDRHPGRAAAAAPPGRARGLGDHRPRGPALLGAPGRRPPHDHAPRVDRGGRGDRRPRERPLGAPADGT